MKLDKIELPVQNKVLHSYNTNKEFVHTYFDYANEALAFPKRLKELTTRAFNRKGVAAVVASFMAPFGLSSTAKKHIDELGNDAVTVIGGQQAGVLTGPLFSIHKAITVILLAKKQRGALGVPVVPVFWVAGEDHDLNEINHVYTQVGGRVTKEQIKDQFVLKLMASDATYNQDEMKRFVTSIFNQYGETAYTSGLLEDVLDALSREETFTGFFVRLMNGLFAEEGLLFIDSAYGPLRELESDYFCRLINTSEKIATAILEKEQQFEREGYGKPLDAKEDAAHLFYRHETGRILLSRRKGEFVNDSVGLRFTTEELLGIAKKEPWLLSNNVATRPLMQDFVFPVLAFVGGPGELAYWALLKEAFHQQEVKMPILVPRMSLTLVTRATAKVLEEKSFTFKDVISGGVAAARDQFITDMRDDKFQRAVDEARAVLAHEYQKLTYLLNADEKMLHDQVQKNLAYHTSQFNYLQEKSEDALLVKHEVALRKYNQVENELFPNGGFQERTYTPYVYMNEYGPTLVKDLLQLPLEIDGTHKIIYL